MADRSDGWALKKRIRDCRVFGYEIAAELNITESALSKQLRAPTKAQEKEIVGALERIIKRRS